MLYYLTGKVVSKNGRCFVLEKQGIGFKIFSSRNTVEGLRLGQEAKIFTFLYFREDLVELYGFLTQKELELFEILNDISGVGPKTALELCSYGDLENLKREMEKEEFYQKGRGIGKKKGQKILLELTGQIKSLTKQGPRFDQALDALVSLGFSRQRAKQALSRVPEEIREPEQRVKQALKNLQ